MSEVGIDALVIKTRAVTRELNGLLKKLHDEGVTVEMLSWPAVRDATNSKPLRCTTKMTFPTETEE